MVAKAVQIGQRLFPRQLDATAHFSEMLAKYKVGSVIEASDASDLSELLLRHRDSTSKIGAGVDFFTTTVSEQGSKCFAIVRIDGTLEPFSFHHCIRRV